MPEEQIPKFDEKCPHKVAEQDECYECDNYRGNRRDTRRSMIVERAVALADRIILENSNGDTEETDFLTGAVAWSFVNKVQGRLQSVMSAHDLSVMVKEGIPQRPTIGGMLDE